MTPYYEHRGITIYHGDAREVLPIIRWDMLDYGSDFWVSGGIARYRLRPISGCFEARRLACHRR